MEEGPFRMPRPAGGAAKKPEPEVRPKQEPQHEAKETPKSAQTVQHKPVVPTNHVNKVPKKKSLSPTLSLQKFILPVLVTVFVGVFAVVAWMGLSSMQNNSSAIDTSKYQAVFLTNGQVYFGKLQSYDSEYMKLTDIFYLQTNSGDNTDSKNPQKTTSDNGDVRLVKLGDEIHGPEDQMVISKDQMLFYENLKPKGKVAQSIDEFKKK